MVKNSAAATATAAVVAPKKIDWKPGTMLYPLPVVMVSLGHCPEEHNIITIAWTGTVCTEPPLCYISVRPQRNSYEILKRTGEFVVNLTTGRLARATDWCGVRSGREHRKFEEMGLTAGPALKVRAPIINEAPINIECRVIEVKPLGSHDMFLAEVVNVRADSQYLDPRTGAFDLARAQPLAYSHGHYFTLGKKIGKFGFSVEKRRGRKGASGPKKRG